MTPRPISSGQRLIDRNFLLLFLASFCFNMDYTLYFLLPYYLELRGSTEVFYGAVAGSFGLSAFFCVMLIGHLGDAARRKWLVIGYMAPFLAANLMAMLAYRAAPEWYFAVRVMHGFSAGLGIPLIYTWSVELGPAERRTEILAYIGMNFLVASYLGPFLGEILLSLHPDPTHPDAYWAVFLASLIISLVGVGAVLATQHSPMMPSRGGSMLGLSTLVFRKASFLILLLVMIFGGVFGVFFAFGKNFTAQLGLEFASVLFGGYASGSIIIRLAIRPMIALLGELTLIPLSLTGFAASFLLLGSAQGYPLLALSGLVCGFSHGLFVPSTMSRLFEVQRPDEMGRASVAFYGVFGAGAGLFPYIGGTLLEALDFRTMYLLMGVVCLLGVPVHYLTSHAAGVQAARMRPAAPAGQRQVRGPIPGRRVITRITEIRIR